MKLIQKITFVAFVVVLSVLILAPAVFAMQEAPPVQLPTDGEKIIQAFFIMVFTGLAKLLFAKTKIDISGYVAVLAAALATFVVTAINVGLAQIPFVFADLANVLLTMLLTWLAGLGLFSAWKHFIAKPFGLKKLRQ